MPVRRITTAYKCSLVAVDPRGLARLTIIAQHLDDQLQLLRSRRNTSQLAQPWEWPFSLFARCAARLVISA